MKSRKEQIEKIVFDGLIKLGKEESIKGFESPSLEMGIRKHLDSMAVVALAVDLEEMYEDQFGNSVRILNEDEADFMDNFETAQSLLNYIESL